MTLNGHVIRGAGVPSNHWAVCVNCGAATKSQFGGFGEEEYQKSYNEVFGKPCSRVLVGGNPPAKEE